MKKLSTLFLSLILVIGTLTGCGNRANEPLTAELIDIELTLEQYAFGVDKNQPQLLEDVNAFIAEIKEDGTLDAICEKYFGNGTPEAVTSAELDTTKDQLVVATNAAFEPFEYTDGGTNFYGIDMEIAALLAEELDMELVIQNMDFDAVCLAVGQQKCDIAMAGLTISEDRKEYVTFSDSYYDACQTLIVTSDCTEFDNCTDAASIEAILNQKDNSCKIGVQNGTTGQLYCEGDEDWGFVGYQADTIGYKNGSLAVQDLLNGNIDYVIIDYAPALCIVEEINKTQEGDFSLKVEQFLKIFIEQNGYVKVLEGLKNTLLIAVTGLVIGILIGTLIATVNVIPKYKTLPRILNSFCNFYVSLFRGTPIVVQLLIFYYVLLPMLGLRMTGVEVSMLVFGLNSAAYISEIMRSGIMSVDGGQMEAGRAVGLSFWTTMLQIVIPQAIKNILPALANELVTMVKESSICSILGMAELIWGAKTVATTTYKTLSPYVLAAFIYFLINFPASKGIEAIERRMRRGDRA
mgnify:CR=1 FL=1